MRNPLLFSYFGKQFYPPPDKFNLSRRAKTIIFKNS